MGGTSNHEVRHSTLAVLDAGRQLLPILSTKIAGFAGVFQSASQLVYLLPTVLSLAMKTPGSLLFLFPMRKSSIQVGRLTP